MENEELEITPETEPEQEPKQVYVPRPAWQVWAARIALVLFIFVVIYQFLAIATGGMG